MQDNIFLLASAMIGIINSSSSKHITGNSYTTYLIEKHIENYVL
jgi:hypothetical protein